MVEEHLHHHTPKAALTHSGNHTEGHVHTDTCAEKHANFEVRMHRGPEISCGCSHCGHDHSAPTAPFATAINQVAERIEHILPKKAQSWFCNLEDEARRDVVCITFATLFFLIGLIARYTSAPALVYRAVFIIAYISVGADILAASIRNIRAGDFFDENLLMSIASLGAFALGEYPEAVAVMMFYRIGEFFEDRAVDRSRDQIMDAVDMRPETVQVIENYSMASKHSGAVDNGEVQTGAIVQPAAMTDEAAHKMGYSASALPAEDVQVGSYIIIRPGERIPLDSTVVKGESRIDTSPVTGEPVPVAVRCGMQVTSGCVNETGQLIARVDKPLSESMVTRILDAVEHAAANKPQLERFITRFARVYTPIVIAIAAATAILPSLLTGNWARWLYTACTFLVISCPCAIVLSVPLSFFAGIGAASKQGILFKGGNAIEALNNVGAVVMDKTGTITRGSFEVQQINPAKRFSEAEVLTAAASAEQASTHPIAQSIVLAARDRKANIFVVSQIEEVAGMGVCATVGSAVQDQLSVAVGNAKLMQQVGIVLPPDVQVQEDGTLVHVAIEGVYAGSISIADAIKPESPEAIRQLSTQGIHTAMLTGDASMAAKEIAHIVGVDEVHAELLPEEKVEALQQLRSAHGSALFVGDGINDAPVLAAADVGAAMGSGSDAAIEAADVVFMTSSLAAVPESLNIARKVHTVAVQNIVFALAVKLGIMVLGFAGMASMWAAVFADVGVALLCILNAIRLLHMKF